MYRALVSVFDSRLYAYALAIVAVGVVASPALVAKPRDGYPLSTYPMFAEDRGRIATVEQAVGITKTGARIPLQPKYFGTDEVLQAKTKLERATRRGTSPALCDEVQKRVAADRDDVVEVVIRTITVDAIDYFSDADRATQSERVYARCKVGS
jgi:hypothetical protein